MHYPPICLFVYSGARVHTSDAVYITFVRNDIITGEKQDSR